MTRHIQVVGIGNAMVDILAHCEESFLVEHGVRKGVMQLIDGHRAADIRRVMVSPSEVSGGSAANTVAGLADLGCRTAYVGKVVDDRLGHVFADDIRSLGVKYETPMTPPGEGTDTGCCMVLVTPDGERSMNTYLGASETLGSRDIDRSLMERTGWIYLEGYRFDGPDGHAAFARAIEYCKAGGGCVSLTLSDPYCVSRHLSSFRRMVRDDVDLLFCNQHELKALYGIDDLERAVEKARKEVAILACTLGSEGAVVVSGKNLRRVSARPGPVVDVTGAGDLFAAGFLYGLTAGFEPELCARLGCLSAGEVIRHVGARPRTDLRELVHRELNS